MKLPSWKTVLELGRASNLPTCVSNVTAGYCLGGGSLLDSPLSWLKAVGIVFSLYEGGMILNDLWDRKLDAQERPARPIPSGRISVTQAWILFFLCMAFGLFLSYFFLPTTFYSTLFLSLLIIFYNRFHQTFIFSPVVMGLCRFMVYLIAALAAGWQHQESSGALPKMALMLFFYITAVSVVARNELLKKATILQVGSVLVAALAFLIPVFFKYENFYLVAVCAAVGVLWLCLGLNGVLRMKMVPEALVGKILAGMSLLDGLALAIANSFLGVGISWFCFYGTLYFHRRIKGT